MPPAALKARLGPVFVRREVRQCTALRHGLQNVPKTRSDKDFARKCAMASDAHYSKKGR